MVRSVSTKDILERNPQVNRDEIEAVSKIISETSGTKTIGTHKASRSPYSRPTVRLDRQSPPICRASARRC